MHVTTYNTAKDFLTRTQSMLEQREASNNVILGVADAIASTPDRYKEWYLLTVDDGAEVKLAGVWTPPFNLTIDAETLDPAAMQTLAEYFRDRAMILPGVTAPVDVATAFGDIWAALTGGTWHVELHMRLYELRQVIPVQGIKGQFVVASAEHQAIVAQWASRFHDEALAHPVTTEDANQIASRHIEQQALCLWCVDGQPVSMAARGRQTRHGATVGLVYTPPELRGHGYASALVAGCSQMILESGKEFCVLFTDLSNPTSNSIYQKIGYYPLEDFDDLKFERSDSV